jgi:hypothetical protein
MRGTVMHCSSVPHVSQPTTCRHGDVHVAAGVAQVLAQRGSALATEDAGEGRRLQQQLEARLQHAAATVQQLGHSTAQALGAVWPLQLQL